jgi:hypothetical protein
MQRVEDCLQNVTDISGTVFELQEPENKKIKEFSLKMKSF